MNNKKLNFSKQQSTPLKDDFYFPAEWESHQGCLLIWPYNHHEWKSQAIPAQKTFIELTNILINYEDVIVFVDPKQYEIAKQQLHPKVKLIKSKNNISWARDHCPTFVITKAKNQIRVVIWKFNEWGFIHPDEAQYPSITKRWLKENNIQSYLAPLILEGGAFHVDGIRTCITTEECLMNINRNRNILTKKEVEILLQEYLNITKVIWLKHGSDPQDITDGHIDGILTFIKPGKILFSWNQNPTQEQLANYETLKNNTDVQGNKLEIIKINEPKPLILNEEEYHSFHPEMLEYMNYQKNKEIWFGYVNLYIGNNVVLVPQYGHDKLADQAALNIIEKQFPDHKVIGINTKEFSLSGGNIHCMTQQIPKINFKN